VTFAYLSLDDMLRLHERLGDAIGIDNIETLIFAPLYAMVLMLLWGLARELGPPFDGRLKIGVAILVGAVAVDSASALTRDLEDGGPQAIRIAVEEGFEIAGWTLIAASLLVVLGRALITTGPWPSAGEESGALLLSPGSRGPPTRDTPAPASPTAG